MAEAKLRALFMPPSRGWGQTSLSSPEREEILLRDKRFLEVLFSKQQKDVLKRNNDDDIEEAEQPQMYKRNFNNNPWSEVLFGLPPPELLLELATKLLGKARPSATTTMKRWIAQ